MKHYAILLTLACQLSISCHAFADEPREIRVINPKGRTQVGDVLVTCEPFATENRCICTKGTIPRTWIGCAVLLTKFTRWNAEEFTLMVWANNQGHRGPNPLPTCDQEAPSLLEKKMQECEQLRLKDPRCRS